MDSDKKSTNTGSEAAISSSSGKPVTSTVVDSSHPIQSFNLPTVGNKEEHMPNMGTKIHQLSSIDVTTRMDVVLEGMQSDIHHKDAQTSTLTPQPVDPLAGATLKSDISTSPDKNISEVLTNNAQSSSTMRNSSVAQSQIVSSNFEIMGDKSRIGSGHHAASPDDDDDDDHRVIETDPTGRFERFSECLGKGAYKEVFKAFDQEEGVEVAWNQLRLDHLSKKDAVRVLTEIQLLENLRNDYIINLFYSWVAKNHHGKDQVYFITELMTSGTLKSYIRKTKGQIKPKILRNWAKQILNGLLYLHTRDPPIIHRDLKSENIFINGNHGQAKIGDLGLAAVKRREHLSSVLGTPEFMAPELYDEKYNEKVDIYAFGMVLLEIVTKEYPYSECTNQAQIYKKVSSGIKPLALSKVTDEETRKFIELCIEFNPDRRPSAAELLQHQFIISTAALPGTGVPELTIDSLVPTQYSSGPPSAIASTGTSTTASHQIPFSSATRTSIVPQSALTTDPQISAVDSRSVRPAETLTLTPLAEAVSGASVPQQEGSIESLPVVSVGGNVNSTTQPQLIPTTVDAENHTFYIMQRNSVPSSTSMQPGAVCLIEALGILMSTTNPSQIETVNLKMTYRSGKTTQEIKFPFLLAEDTATDVVSEMVREGLLNAADEQVARRRIEEVVRFVLMRRRSSDMSNQGANNNDPRASKGANVSQNGFDVEVASNDSSQSSTTASDNTTGSTVQSAIHGNSHSKQPQVPYQHQQVRKISSSENRLKQEVHQQHHQQPSSSLHHQRQQGVSITSSTSHTSNESASSVPIQSDARRNPEKAPYSAESSPQHTHTETDHPPHMSLYHQYPTNTSGQRERRTSTHSVFSQMSTLSSGTQFTTSPDFHPQQVHGIPDAFPMNLLSNASQSASVQIQSNQSASHELLMVDRAIVTSPSMVNAEHQQHQPRNNLHVESNKQHVGSFPPSSTIAQNSAANPNNNSGLKKQSQSIESLTSIPPFQQPSSGNNKQQVMMKPPAGIANSVSPRLGPTNQFPVNGNNGLPPKVPFGAGVLTSIGPPSLPTCASLSTGSQAQAQRSLVDDRLRQLQESNLLNFGSAIAAANGSGVNIGFNGASANAFSPLASSLPSYTPLSNSTGIAPYGNAVTTSSNQQQQAGQSHPGSPSFTMKPLLSSRSSVPASNNSQTSVSSTASSNTQQAWNTVSATQITQAPQQQPIPPAMHTSFQQTQQPISVLSNRANNNIGLDGLQLPLVPQVPVQQQQGTLNNPQYQHIQRERHSSHNTNSSESSLSTGGASNAGGGANGSGNFYERPSSSNSTASSFNNELI